MEAYQRIPVTIAFAVLDYPLAAGGTTAFRADRIAAVKPVAGNPAHSDVWLAGEASARRVSAYPSQVGSDAGNAVLMADGSAYFGKAHATLLSVPGQPGATDVALPGGAGTLRVSDYGPDALAQMLAA